MTWNGLLPTPTVSLENEPDHNWKDGEVWWKQTRASRNLSALVEHPERLTSSQQASHANPPPALEKEKARQMTDGSGRRCLQRFKRLVRDGCFWKMSLVSSLLSQEWYSSAAALIWKLKGTRFNRCLFQLAVSTPRTGENGCGLLQSPMPSDVDGGRTTKGSKRQGEMGLRGQLLSTPKCTESGPDFARMNREGSGGDDLVTQIAMLRTPRSSDADHGGPNQRDSAGYPGLPGQIAMLPTPTSRDHKSEKCSQQTAERNARPLSETIGTNTGMRLQPAFVEWMLGYPEGWTELESYPSNPRYRVKQREEFTDCEPLATASYPKSPLKS